MVLLYLRTIRRIRIESFYLTIRTRTGAACIDKVTVFCTESEVTKMQNASSSPRQFWRAEISREPETGDSENLLNFSSACRSLHVLSG